MACPMYFVTSEGVIEFSSRPKYENVVISVFIEGGMRIEPAVQFL